MWGTLGLVLMVVAGLVTPGLLIRFARWRAARRLTRLRAGQTARIPCRLEVGSTVRGRRGRLIACGLGGHLAFQPRFRGQRPLAAHGMLLSVEQAPAGIWDNPHLGVRVIHYRTPAGRNLRLRLRATNVATVSELLTAAASGVANPQAAEVPRIPRIPRIPRASWVPWVPRVPQGEDRTPDRRQPAPSAPGLPAGTSPEQGPPPPGMAEAAGEAVGPKPRPRPDETAQGAQAAAVEDDPVG